MTPIEWADFEKVDMRVGRVRQVTEYPEARKPSYRLRIDFGPELGIKRTVAALGQIYKAGELEGRLVVAVTNFHPRQIRKASVGSAGAGSGQPGRFASAPRAR